MTPPTSQPDHSCDWQAYAKFLEKGLTDRQLVIDEQQRVLQDQQRVLQGQQRQLEALRADKFGGKRKSEKASRVGPKGPSADAEETRRKRAAAAQARAEAALQEQVVEHPVPADERTCGACGGVADRELPPEESVVYEYVPGHFVREVHRRQRLACRCGECILTAPTANKVWERARFGPGLVAHTMVSKCLDALPLFRIARILGRAGVDISDRTLGRLFHHGADQLLPLYQRLRELVCQSELVMADETPIAIMAKLKTRRGYVWTFRTENIVLYVASAGRSGETPVAVLGDTKGVLLVDGYTGYNQVTTPQGRNRAGCWAHARRKFVEAIDTEQELAAEVIALIAELYAIESKVRNAGTLGSKQHQTLRQTETREVMTRIATWLEAAKDRCLPKGPLSQAIGYARNQWPQLQLCCDDATIPLDNNLSENALRAVAIGRKNWMFAGNDMAAQRYAVLLSLLTTAVANGLNPEHWLKATLMALDDTKMSDLDALLPLPPVTAAPSAAPADST
jgi:transposase